jgi:hypothetical protein
VTDELRDGALFTVGEDLADVQALLGHKSPKTARHAEVSVDKLVTAVQRMEHGWNYGTWGLKSV